MLAVLWRFLPLAQAKDGEKDDPSCSTPSPSPLTEFLKFWLLKISVRGRSGFVRGPFGVCARSVRGPFGLRPCEVRAGTARGPHGVRAGSVRGPFAICSGETVGMVIPVIEL